MKNRVLRSTLVVILVIAMVLTMAACGQKPVEKTEKPVVTDAPKTDAPKTDAPATDAPTKAPIANADEAKLAEYGVTFSGADSTFGSATAFSISTDAANKYIGAYTFTYDVDVDAENFEGDTIKSGDGGYIKAGSGAGTTVTPVAAGIYTITYEVDVKVAKKTTYNLYAAPEVDETYVVTKTYTVNKKAVEIQTPSDAYLVNANDINFYDSAVAYSVAGATLASNNDYVISPAISVTDGKTVGEFPISIAIKYDGEVISAEDIVAANYTYSLNEGTRYILSKEDYAKANVVRKMVYIDSNDGVADNEIEYTLETIAAYNALTAGQKVLAQDAANDSVVGNASPTLVKPELAGISCSEAAMKLAQYNLDRAGLIDDAKDAINAYVKAATGTNKEAAQQSLAEFFLSIDNTANEYGSDLLFVLANIAGVADYTTNAKEIDYAYSDTQVIFHAASVAADGKSKAAFDTNATAALANGAVNYVFDKIKADYTAKTITTTAVTSGTINQATFTTLASQLAAKEAAYSKLVDFQAESVKTAHETAVASAKKLLAKWDAYIAVIDAYGFDASYIDNARAGKYDATQAAMANVLGYDLVNETLNATVTALTATGKDDLVSVIFLAPELYMEDAIAEYQSIIELLLAAQDEAAAAKSDLVNFIIDELGGSAYTAINGGTASAAVTTIATAKNLADLYKYIDQTIAAKFNSTNLSSTLKDVADDGAEVVIAEMMEKINEDVQDRASDLAKNGLSAELTYTTTNLNATPTLKVYNYGTTVASGADGYTVTYAVSNADTVKGAVNASTGEVTTALEAGDVITATIAFGGKTITVTQAYKAS